MDFSGAIRVSRRFIRRTQLLGCVVRFFRLPAHRRPGNRPDKIDARRIVCRVPVRGLWVIKPRDRKYPGLRSARFLLSVAGTDDQSVGRRGDRCLTSDTRTRNSGTATKVDTYLFTANYALAEQWSANGRAGYITTDYIDSPRRDDSWTLGGTLTYNLGGNLGLTIDYQHIELSSNVPAAGFTRDVVTLGGTWRY